MHIITSCNWFPGFEVVPVPVVDTAIKTHKLALTSSADARCLAQLLQVDAVVIGAVTEYTPYYPPRLGLQVEWYAANPGFHPIPPGYGLPWGTHEEADIPGPLVQEAEFALAKEQLKTQTPLLGGALASQNAQAKNGHPDAKPDVLPPRLPRQKSRQKPLRESPPAPLPTVLRLQRAIRALPVRQPRHSGPTRAASSRRRPHLARQLAGPAMPR